MKVAILAPLPPPAGGIGAWMVRMLDAKLKNGWEIVHVDESLIGKRTIFGSKRRFSEEFRRNIKLWTSLIRVLRDPEIKVVHSCIPSATFSMMREYICALITKMYRRKFIIHYRCTISNYTKGRLGYFVFKKLTGLADFAMVLNTESKKTVEEYSDTPNLIIPNFVKGDLVLQKGQKQIADTVRTALFVGGVVPKKGCNEIIDAAKQFPEITFRLVGHAPTEFESIPDNVIITGEKSKKEVEQEMIDADLFVFPSWSEGFSNALVEAMANGLPCIATELSANCDALEDKGGILIPVNDSKALIEAIKKIKDDKCLRQSMSDFNIEKVNASYTEKVVLEQYVDVYESIL